jgi:hypothetical protein
MGLECDDMTNCCVPVCEGLDQCMPNEVDDGCEEGTECEDGCCVPVCDGEPQCFPNEVDDGCPDNYVCEGDCCVPSCEDEEADAGPGEVLASFPPEETPAGTMSWQY